ncbi:nucleotidyltransferase [Segetibacter sp. 3557_3]|uniref:HI0074 family nucleotidyltransferase substrate-binding subunit n=1 Tax=Segetibacter sp. 3557_3 TaxID=2547429 RepID=UPI00105919E1|nr:HI0074 family nucleotidyltransferase substrate-binding subunit [Segetibacter sp. 3557_3]TDH24593.1 nucleotidyltransferase [Segetibacter sp. 3557_3]
MKASEYTYKLACNTIKDLYQEQGETSIQGSRNAIKMSFKRGLIEDGQSWMDMVQSRIKTSHTYNQETANEIANEIVSSYYNLFLAFQKQIEMFRKSE